MEHTIFTETVSVIVSVALMRFFKILYFSGVVEKVLEIK